MGLACQNNLGGWGERAVFVVCKSTSALSNEAITVNFSGVAPVITVDVFAISGADTTIINDSNVALPNTTVTSGNTVSLTTSNANDFLIGFYGFNSTANPTQGAGWTLISGANFFMTEYKIVSATQSGTVATIGTGDTDEAAGIADAVIAASGGPPLTSVYFDIQL
jgi:hypothetical protein